MRIGVPAPPEPFVGRVEELESLKAALTQGQRVAIVGTRETPGVGRTALADAIVSDEALVGPRGAYVAALGWSLRRDGRRPHLALAGWLDALGAPLAGSASIGRLVQAVTSAMATRGPVLLVVDGVTAADVPAVSRLLQRFAPDTGALVTADDLSVARALGLSALQVAPLSDDEGPELLELMTESAVPAVIANAMLTAVAHLPLGVRIAGSRLRRASAEESGSWGGEVDPRRAQRLGGPVGVARSFLDVYRRLGEASGRVLRALGACSAGPVTADRIAGLLALAPDIAHAELSRLEGSGLVSRIADDEWEVHTLLVSFARQLLDEAGEADRLAKRRLAAVLQSEGVPTDVVPAAEILEVCDEAVLEGDEEDIVALATRVSEGMAGWCVEGAVSLVRAAAEAGARSRSRAQGVVRTRRESVERMAAAAGVAEGDLPPPAKLVEDAADPFERGVVAPLAAAAPHVVDALSRRTAVPTAEREPSFPSVVPDSQAVRSADPSAWWVVRADDSGVVPADSTSRGVRLVDDGAMPSYGVEVDDPSVSGSVELPDFSSAPAVSTGPDTRRMRPVSSTDDAESTGAVAVRRITGAADAALYGIARHVSAAHGDSDAEVRSGCLTRARDAASTIAGIHERLSDLGERSERDVRGRQDPALRDPLDRLGAATRQVFDALRAARAAVPVIEHAGDLERMRRAAERAERARDEAGGAADEGDAAWTALQDALSEVQATHARRRATLVRGRRDAAQARTLYDDAATKIRAWRLTYEGDETWSDVDAELDAARKAVDRAEVALAALDTVPEPEAFGAAIAAARGETEKRSRDAVAVATRRVELARDAARAREHRREVGEHADRAERGARAFEELYGRMTSQLAGSSAAEAVALARRVDLLSTRVQRARRLAKDAHESAPGRGGRASPEAIDRLAAAARDVMTCVAEAERLAADVDNWSATSSESATEQARLEALSARWVALAGAEATAAVARRASSRANLAAAAASDAEVRRVVAQLEAQEVELREVLDHARSAVDALEPMRGHVFDVGVDNADEAIERAASHAERARQLSESLLELADGQRRAAVDELRGDGRALADRVTRCHAEMTHIADEVGRAWSRLGDDGATWRTSFEAALGRVSDAQLAVDDGLARLVALTDPQLLARVVDAMQDAVDVAASSVIESESLRVKVRAAAARVPAVVTADEPTDPRVADVTAGRVAEDTAGRLERTAARVVTAPAFVVDEPTVPSIELRESTELRIVAEATAATSPAVAEPTIPFFDETTATEVPTHVDPDDGPVGDDADPDAWVHGDGHVSGHGEPDLAWGAPEVAAAEAAPESLDTFDDFDPVTSPVSDEDLARVEEAAAAALVAVPAARAAFVRARGRAGAGDATFAELVRAHALLIEQATTLAEDLGEASRDRSTRAGRVAELVEIVVALSAAVVRPVPAPTVVVAAPAPVPAPAPPKPAAVPVATLAAWEAAVEGWAAGWTDTRVVVVADAARAALARARGGGELDLARRAVDALAVEVDDAARARRAAWDDTETRGAGAARVALAALRAGDLSTAAEHAELAVSASDAAEVRCAVALVWHALGRVADAVALVAWLPDDDGAVAQVRRVLATPAPTSPDVLAWSGLVAADARRAIHRRRPTTAV